MAVHTDRHQSTLVGDRTEKSQGDIVRLKEKERERERDGERERGPESEKKNKEQMFYLEEDFRDRIT